MPRRRTSSGLERALAGAAGGLSDFARYAAAELLRGKQSEETERRQLVMAALTSGLGPEAVAMAERGDAQGLARMLQMAQLNNQSRSEMEAFQNAAIPEQIVRAQEATRNGRFDVSGRMAQAVETATARGATTDRAGFQHNGVPMPTTSGTTGYGKVEVVQEPRTVGGETLGRGDVVQHTTSAVGRVSPVQNVLPDDDFRKRVVRADPETQSRAFVSISGLRNTKEATDAMNAINRFEGMKSLAGKSARTGFDDVAMLYNYITALDPDSVVREGEVKLTDNVRSYLASLGLSWEKIAGQGAAIWSPSSWNSTARILRDEQYQQMVSSVAPVMNRYYTRAQTVDRLIRGIGERGGIMNWNEFLLLPSGQDGGAGSNQDLRDLGILR